jgi:hypothetical protein
MVGFSEQRKACSRSKKCSSRSVTCITGDRGIVVDLSACLSGDGTAEDDGTYALLLSCASKPLSGRHLRSDKNPST